MIRRSSSSAAVIAETVVALNSVNCDISTREIGPNRRIASITWKRLIARINSGSAVFIAGGGLLRRIISSGAGINFIPPEGVSMAETAVLRQNGPRLTGADRRDRFNTHSGQIATNVRR